MIRKLILVLAAALILASLAAGQAELVKAISGEKAVPAEKDFEAYLFVYFTDETHGVHMALSRDGYSFTAINNAQPIFKGSDLAEQKGIRDVHLMRGPDNAFYLSMTDLHIFAKREGLRETEWERPGEIYGWGNNRGIILMKSFDLVHWTHHEVRLDQAFPELEEIGCAWAPQTIWDAEKNQPMVYFTLRMKNEKNRLFYSYANKDFTKLETRPELLFEYPRDISYIDGDITKVGDRFHLFYVAHEKGGGIKQAVSNKINSGYVFQPAKVDPERVAAEAPNVWKRNGSETYVLMYDVFGAKPNNMGFSETTDFVHFKDLGHFNKGVMKTTNFEKPKHGAVISLTSKEAQDLAARWKIANF